jgi:hypothetical protein
VYIDHHFLSAGKYDLAVEVTPCIGRVTFYISEDYLSLFNGDKQRYTEIVTEQKNGKMNIRVPQVEQFKVLYIGIMSSNEWFEGLEA